jgi:hypothetical protein
MNATEKALKDDQARIQKIIDSEDFQWEVHVRFVKSVVDFREELKLRLKELAPVTATYVNERQTQQEWQDHLVDTVIKGLGLDAFEVPKKRPAKKN